jgi:hypothetical protein
MSQGVAVPWSGRYPIILPASLYHPRSSRQTEKHEPMSPAHLPDARPYPYHSPVPDVRNLPVRVLMRRSGLRAPERPPRWAGWRMVE